MLYWLVAYGSLEVRVQTTGCGPRDLAPLRAYLSIYIYIYIHIYIYIYIYLSVCLSVCLSVYLCLSLSLSLSEPRCQEVTGPRGKVKEEVSGFAQWQRTAR